MNAGMMSPRVTANKADSRDDERNAERLLLYLCLWFPKRGFAWTKNKRSGYTEKVGQRKAAEESERGARDAEHSVRGIQVFAESLN